MMACIKIEPCSLGISTAVDILREVVESEGASQYVHFAIEGFPQWLTLCALEDAFIANNLCTGWSFVVGATEDDALIKGWLEYEDWIVVPRSPATERGAHISVWSREDWDEGEYTVRAVSPAGPESGIVLNAISKSLGYGVLGETSNNP
jgi:hypothetical protein